MGDTTRRRSEWFAAAQSDGQESGTGQGQGRSQIQDRVRIRSGSGQGHNQGQDCSRHVLRLMPCVATARFCFNADVAQHFGTAGPESATSVVRRFFGNGQEKAEERVQHKQFYHLVGCLSGQVRLGLVNLRQSASSGAIRAGSHAFARQTEATEQVSHIIQISTRSLKT